MTAAVVGNLPVEELIATVTEAFDHHYSSSKKYQRNPIPDLSPEKPFTEIVRHEYTDESLQQARLVMVWRVPGMEDLDETYALDILAVILGQGKVSRLFRECAKKKV